MLWRIHKMSGVYIDVSSNPEKGNIPLSYEDNDQK